MPISLKANSDGSSEILNGVVSALKINTDNSLETQGSLDVKGNVDALELISDTWKNVDGTENYKCKCWVNFDGTTTPPTIRASGNVSSVVRDATGQYTVNFENAMEDENYSASLLTNGPTNDDGSKGDKIDGSAMSAGSVVVFAYQKENNSATGGQFYNPSLVMLQIFH